jgi:ferredoxin
MLDLEKAAGWLSSVTPVRVESGLCTRARSPRSTCNACVAVCPVEAIELGRGPQVSTEACTACGLCVAACPTGALKLDAPSDTALLAAARKADGEPLVLACGREAPALESQVAGRLVTVPCIGAVPAELLAGMLASGHEQIFLWRPAACDSCPNGCFSDRLLADALHAVDELYPGAVTSGAVVPGAPARAATTASGPGFDEALAGQDRRAFLGGMARSGGGLLQALLGDWFVKPKEPERKPMFDLTGTPRRREILAAALATRPAGEGAALPESAPCASEACTFCPVCSRLCPSAALQVAVEGDRVALQWQASRCTDCRLCREVCPAHALSTGDRISPERFLAKAPEELVAGTRTTCACGSVYWQVEGGPSTCMACRMRAPIV